MSKFISFVLFVPCIFLQAIIYKKGNTTMRKYILANHNLETKYHYHDTVALLQYLCIGHSISSFTSCFRYELWNIKRISIRKMYLIRIFI